MSMKVRDYNINNIIFIFSPVTKEFYESRKLFA